MLRAALALAAAFVFAACRRAPVPDDANAGVILGAPAPSSTTVASPLAGQTTDYTNEMQAQNLRAEAAELGIKKFGRPSADGADAEEGRAPLTYKEGLEQTRLLAKEFEAQRHVVDKDKNKTVVLPTSVPGILPGKKEGAPIEPAPEEAGSKDPETK